MARVTVEDCLKNVENRFDLVIKASARAHALELGMADAMVSVDNDKPTVIALREIAAGYDVTKAAVVEEEASAETETTVANSEATEAAETQEEVAEADVKAEAEAEVEVEVDAESKDADSDAAKDA